MNYLFENKELIFFMLNHLNRRSISEALYKILISNNVQIQDTEIKTEIYNKILDIFDGTDIEVSFIINSSFSKAKIFVIYLQTR